MKNAILLLSILISVVVQAQNYNFLGDYTSNGTPLYLENPGDNVNNSTLDLISNALPEGYPVPDYNPHYISSGYDTDITINANADVWVTFVQEGAGYRNVLGFYTYNTGNPPASIPSPEDITIIFPNVSALGSGGGLIKGDKVKIGSFTPGTSVGWVLLANGWNGSKVTSGNWQVFSNPDYNPENNPDLKHHNVLLADTENNRIILGFEDILRDNSSCDNDFNDAVFYVTANPYTALKTANINDINTATDVTSANSGGLESNGTLAGLIAKRNFTRTKNNSKYNSKTFQKEFNKSHNKFLKSTQAGALENYIPETGMFGNETSFISSPEDLVEITNAEDVFSVDYYSGENRISAILATKTVGSVYDHTKVICDRLNSSSLEDIRTVIVRGHQIIGSKIKRASGEIENSISFSIKQGDSQNELYSFWGIEQYPNGNYYNFQIWGSSYSQVFALANQILDTFSNEKPLVSTNSEDKIPSVFVKSGYYNNGNIYLNIINKLASAYIQVNGSLSPTENSNRIEMNQTINLSGNWDDSIQVYTGNLFDIGLSISTPESLQEDALYLADGPWGLDYLETETKIEDFSVGNFTADFDFESYQIERNPIVLGEIKGTLNLFRQLLPGHQSLDVTHFNSLTFSVINSHAVEIILLTDDLQDWNNRLRKTIPANSELTDYSIFFNEFVDSNGKNNKLEKVNRIVFSIQGDYNNFVPFSIEINNAGFSKNTITSANTTNLENLSNKITNYPNPFNQFTTIQLPVPIKQAEIRVFDLTGRIVDIQQIENIQFNNKIKYKAKERLNGLYKYAVTDELGNKYNGSFLIN